LVIDAFFVRAADDFVRHHEDLGGRRDEHEHFFDNVGIVADIGPSENQRLRSVTSACSAGTMPTVSVVAVRSSGP
jgi:hypothetical protein